MFHSLPEDVWYVIISSIGLRHLCLLRQVCRPLHDRIETDETYWRLRSLSQFQDALSRKSPCLIEKLGSSWKENFAALNRFKCISMSDEMCGSNFSAVVTNNGHLFTFGEDPVWSNDLVEMLELQRASFIHSVQKSFKEVSPLANRSLIQPTPTSCFSLDCSLTAQYVKFVCVSDSHMMILTDGGSLFVFGLGLHGKLGTGSDEDVCVPRQITSFPLDSRVVFASVSSKHSAVICDDGKTYTFGDNDYGKLGHGDEISVNIPKEVQYFTESGIHIVAVSCGEDHTLWLDTNGNAYSAGCCYSGRLGVESVNNGPKNDDDVKVEEKNDDNVEEDDDDDSMNQSSSSSSSSSRGETGDKEVEAEPSSEEVKQPQPPPIPPRPNKKTKKKEEEEHKLPRKEKKPKPTILPQDRPHAFVPQKIRFCDPSSSSGCEVKIIQISAGERHSGAVDSQGRIWLWGSANRIGLGWAHANRIDNPGLNPQNVCDSIRSAFLVEPASGDLLLPQLVTCLPPKAKISAISLRSRHSLALTTEGRVIAWGRGWNYRLGSSGEGDWQVPQYVEFPNSNAEPRFVGISAGSRSSIAIDDRGRVYSWGSGPSVGFKGDMDSANSSSQLLGFHKRPSILPLPSGERAVATSYVQFEFD